MVTAPQTVDSIAPESARGHWKNRYWLPEVIGALFPDDVIRAIGPGVDTSPWPYSTEGEARTVAAEFIAGDDGWRNTDGDAVDAPRIIYLGPVFFPEAA